jgi:hypothetical protein
MAGRVAIRIREISCFANKSFQVFSGEGHLATGDAPGESM